MSSSKDLNRGNLTLENSFKFYSDTLLLSSLLYMCKRHKSKTKSNNAISTIKYGSQWDKGSGGGH